MAHIPYVIKKDGRYWLQKRFAAKDGFADRRPSHLRICLRTSDRRLAVDRMLRLMFEIQAYESCPDLFAEERLLLRELEGFVDNGVPRTVAELLQRRLTETLGQRYIDAARLRSHAPSSEFWLAWKAFMEQTVKGEERALRADAPPDLRPGAGRSAS